MPFHSLIFLFLFLPVFLLIYYLLAAEKRNIFLLLSGLFFYAWGQKEAVFILIALILINYQLGVRIGESSHQGRARRVLVFGLTVNVLILVFYKYLPFLLGSAGIEFSLEGLPYPTGISFMTFLAVSYLTDIYRNSVDFRRDFTTYALYVSLFPKVITGPITPWASFKGQIEGRGIAPDDLSRGIKKFITGLGKKVLIADLMSETADSIFSIPATDLTAPLAWTGLLAYALQIYFDFSGYSDMAIGLGRMMGFRIPENFNYPYISDSIQNFWERWHTTLGQWLKTYLFLPIAYSVLRLTKKSKVLKVRIEHWAYLTGIISTFALCGFWHGAAWTFVLWGLYFGILLGAEHLGIRKAMKRRVPRWLRIALIQFFVLMGWVLFRSPDIGSAFRYFSVLFGGNAGGQAAAEISYYLNRQFVFTALLGTAFSLPLYPLLKKGILRIQEMGSVSGGMVCRSVPFIRDLASTMFYSAVLVLSIMSVSAGTYQAFIYFRF